MYNLICVTRPCNVFRHVTARYKSSFLLLLLLLLKEWIVCTTYMHRKNWYISTLHKFSPYYDLICLPSVLWRCWLGGRKGIRPVKTEWSGAGVVVCLERLADLHMAQLMSLPLTFSCFSKIQIGFTFRVPAHPDSPRKRAVKRECVCVWFDLLQFPMFDFIYWKKVAATFLQEIHPSNYV